MEKQKAEPDSGCNGNCKLHSLLNYTFKRKATIAVRNNSEFLWPKLFSIFLFAIIIN